MYGRNSSPASWPPTPRASMSLQWRSWSWPGTRWDDARRRAAYRDVTLGTRGVDMGGRPLRRFHAGTRLRGVR